MQNPAFYGSWPLNLNQYLQQQMHQSQTHQPQPSQHTPLATSPATTASSIPPPPPPPPPPSISPPSTPVTTSFPNPPPAYSQSTPHPPNLPHRTPSTAPTPTTWKPDSQHYDSNPLHGNPLFRQIQPTAWSRARNVHGMDPLLLPVLLAPPRPRGVCAEIAKRRSLHGTHSHKEYSRKRTDVHAPEEYAREEPVHRRPGTISSWTDWPTRTIEEGPSHSIHAAVGRQHRHPSSIDTTTPSQGTTTAPDPSASGSATKTDWEASNSWHPPYTREATASPLQNFQSCRTLCTSHSHQHEPHHNQTTFQRHPHHHRHSIHHHQHLRHQQSHHPCQLRRPQQNPHPENGRHPPSKHHLPNPDSPSPSDPGMRTHQLPSQSHLPALLPLPTLEPQMSPTPPPLQRRRNLFTFNTQNWLQLSNPPNP